MPGQTAAQRPPAQPRPTNNGGMAHLTPLDMLLQHLHCPFVTQHVPVHTWIVARLSASGNQKGSRIGSL